MASVVAADYYSTTSTTVIDTITSCGPEVTNCPGKTYPTSVAKATYSPVVYANSSTPCTESATAGYTAPTTYPAYPVSSPAGGAVYPVSSPAGGAVYPVSSPVSLATSYITTCIPTVITKVYTVAPTPVASGTGYISYPANGTTPYATSTPSSYVTGAASSVERSVVLAAFAGVAAFLFA